MSESAADKIQRVLLTWRKAEIEHALAVLRSKHPHEIEQLADAEHRALSDLRILVDSEPWADLKAGL